MAQCKARETWIVNAVIIEEDGEKSIVRLLAGVRYRTRAEAQDAIRRHIKVIDKWCVYVHVHRTARFRPPKWQLWPLPNGLMGVRPGVGTGLGSWEFASGV